MSEDTKKSFKFGKRLAQNTISNYLSIAIIIVSGIFLTSFLFKGLGFEFYGFWSLLWTIFGFSVLLDLGLGKSLEKYCAEASFSGNMDKFNSILSTIIFAYCIIALVIIIIGGGMAFYLDSIFNLNQGKYVLNVAYYRKVFMLFTLGIALVFPTGVFPTILLAMQRSHLRNYVIVINKLIEVVGVWYIFHTEHSLMTLIIFTTSINLLSNIVMAIMAFRIMPGLKIRFRYIKTSTLKYISNFSFYISLLTICDLIIFSTDRLLLGMMANLSSIAVYHIATKIPLMISKVSTPFQGNLAPIAAILHKSGDKEKLQQTMFDSTRITVFICTGAFTVAIPLVRPILYRWLKIEDETTIMVSYILICSMFILIIFRDTAKHFLLMTGHHRLFTKIAMAEAISNITLSIIFVKLLGASGAAMGVALGTLIPNVIISLMIIFPLAAKHSGASTFAYLVKVYLPVILFAAPIALLIIFATHNVPYYKWNLWSLAITAATTGIIYLVVGWIVYVSREEKAQLCSFLPKFVPAKLVKFITFDF
jgi:O-antigen/teichoic acid export membrane protein